MLAALFMFVGSAFAQSPVSFALEQGTQGKPTTLDGRLQLGLSLDGWVPGIGGTVQVGQRLRVDGKIFAGVPLASGLNWTGGTRVGLVSAPLSFDVGTKASVDVEIGAGARLTATGGGKANGTSWSLQEWLSSTLVYTPNGRWFLFGGVEAQDVSKTVLVPTAGVRVPLRSRNR